MTDWYKACDLFVLTSHHEGFPNVLLEAMAHGRAVLSVDCEAGPRHIVRDGVDGLLVPPGQSHALVEGLTRLMSDDELRTKLGEAALDVRARFDEQKIIARWETLFPQERR